VSTLAWNSNGNILYIGGRFNLINGGSITSGICQWTAAAGIIPFEGGGLTVTPDGVDGEADILVYSPRTQVGNY
jgi:hypothetical protein